MGCKSSKDAAEDNAIDSKFEWVHLARFDEVFENAAKILESCETIRGGLEDSKGDGQEIAGTDRLKDGKYIETLRVLLWSISSQKKGNNLEIEPSVTNDAPYLDIDVKFLNHESKRLYETFKDYVTTVKEGPETVKTALENLEEISKNIPDAIKNAKADLEASSMGFADKAKALNKINKNSQKLPKELAKCKRLKEVLEEAAKDIKETVPELKNLLKGADDIGHKAAADKLYKPKEIFDKYHPGEKLPEDHKPAEKKKESSKSPEKKPEEKKANA